VTDDSNNFPGGGPRVSPNRMNPSDPALDSCSNAVFSPASPSSGEHSGRNSLSLKDFFKPYYNPKTGSIDIKLLMARIFTSIGLGCFFGAKRRKK
jgi:LPXTG-motif cell wall-anchored protein